MLPELATQHLSPAAQSNITQWLSQPKYAEYKADLEALIANEKWRELEDAFFKVIEFGTAGRRGTTGLGSNRINRVTIGESAQALCEYVLSFDAEASHKGIVIAYDTRLTSPELGRYTAQVCAANGFTTYFFDSFRSTPELSFAVRHLGAAAGIVISASHNPPADNGFKAYWSDGAQIAAPHDAGILEVAAGIDQIQSVDFDEAVEKGNIIIIGQAVDDAYVAAVTRQSEGRDRQLAIVYSPLHGAGQTNVLPVLRAAGFEDISLVEAQMVPDGNFPTIEDFKPNPQEKSANDRAVMQLLASHADIAITNDPDADRLGVMVRRGEEVEYLTGNQTFVLAADYALAKLKKKGQLTPRHYIASTFVTTDMVQAIADAYDVTAYANLPVGFKYFGALIKSKEDGDEQFVIGGEESYGALKGDYARDKDGASAALAIAELAAELKNAGKTLYDRLVQLYAEHGVYTERMDNVNCPGADGFQQMKTIMASLRQSPPTRIGEHQVTAVLDYQSLERRDLQTGETTPIDSIANNTVALELGEYRRRVTIRPSGTEPKMKFYSMWYEVATSEQATAIEAQQAALHDKLEGLSRELEGLLVS